ncbi:mitogen-activated protein kinase kinase kinase 7 isoform X1 [Hydra vulgaris]|uniref:mitogen-activated protein kinase kinase kinase 7 isoform X1 n=1 Tax=Hydra vulgaris TaxID=6087 RepID=UPI001F5F4BFF|nr:mitogen-activated protein kinase kinase kinase 7 [Hydra vulgaris]
MSCPIDNQNTIDGLPLFLSHGFINEIGYNELILCEEIGRGAYGTVQKAIWRNQMVAIKVSENQNDRREFREEAKRLSIVQHINIIQLYGAVVNGPKLCLVMELAECGSLHALLHPSHDNKTFHYTLAHVLNWALQCAEAVEYLHNIKPMPIIHRDLKPLNMLLKQSGTVLKICDFGTACHPHSEMTANKGSASWMAPQVITGEKYSEKCDVYSFGIILWQMLTRKKPFEGIPYYIMWSVSKGLRPYPIKGIPSCLEVLIQRCWQNEEKDRPAFVDIVKFLRKANLYVYGGTLPLMNCGQFANKQSCWVNSGTKTSIPSKTNEVHISKGISSNYPENFDSQIISETLSTKNLRPSQSQFILIPPDLMPMKPLQDPESIQIYKNYMEELENYLSIQRNIEFLKQKRDNLQSMVDFNSAQKTRQQLLDMHKTIKLLLENERAKFARKFLMDPNLR